MDEDLITNVSPRIVRGTTAGDSRFGPNQVHKVAMCIARKAIGSGARVWLEAQGGVVVRCSFSVSGGYFSSFT